MWSVNAALQRALALARRGPPEAVPLASALGRVLAADLVAREDVPPWDNSAMDGYAVRAADLSGPTTALRLLETIPAGTWPRFEVVEGCASAVMTGAILPPGADAVVPVEDSDRATEGVVTLTGQPTSGRYVRRRGADVSAGAVLLRAGTTLGPGALGLCASQGLTHVDVVTRPRVAIVTTGDELVRPGDARGPAQIFSSNHVTLRALVERAGAVPVDLGQVGDDPEALRAALDHALSHDVVLTTGGVSAGQFDHTRGVLTALGVEVEVYKVRVKPGMPLVIGARRTPGYAAVFGLPGNPVSCMVSFELFVRPFLRGSLGDPRPWPGTLPAVMAHDLISAPGRARFERVRLRREGRMILCSTTGDQSSGVLRSMAEADGLLVLAPETSTIAAGEAVDVVLLDPGFLRGETPDFSW